MLVSTFSIVGYEPQGPAWGIAIASRFLAVGARTCWGAPDAGVAVVQAHLNTDNGREAVALLRQSLAAQDVIDRLMSKDRYRHLRQMAVVDQAGRIATYTGEGCGAWAGGVLGQECAAQGNMLLNGEGCQAMVAHFEASVGNSLARRLVDALAEGDRVGGDSRGRQATALYVTRPLPGERFDVFTEPTIDLRVDDHPDPHTELGRLLDLYELLYDTTLPEEQLPLNQTTISRLQRALAQLGDYHGEVDGGINPALEEAMQTVVRRENLRRRVPLPMAWLDQRVLDYLEQRAQAIRD
jgi:uncharacterized Ntn-hydrolase superfamily protein